MRNCFDELIEVMNMLGRHKVGYIYIYIYIFFYIYLK